MIDFHTHILPGIDDGAKDVSVSAAMLEMEKEQGVNEIVLTPHYYGKFYSPTDFVRRRAAAYEKLLAVAAGEFFFTLGAEIHFSDTLSVNAECRKLAIGDTRYVIFFCFRTLRSVSMIRPTLSLMACGFRST